MDIFFVGNDRRAKCQYCRSLVDLVDLEIPRQEPEKARMAAQSVARPTNDKLARYSMIAGIVGLFGIFPLVASAAAVVMGRKSLALIKQQPDVYTGEKMAQNGLLLGWIGLGIALLVLCFGIAMNMIQFVVLFIQKQ